MGKIQRKWKFLRAKSLFLKQNSDKTYLETEQIFYSDMKQMTRALKLNSMKVLVIGYMKMPYYLSLKKPSFRCPVYQTS